MKSILHEATLLYYDGPQVFEARDEIGGHYVAVMVDSPHGDSRYLVVGVSPERLRDFRTARLDLRSLIERRAEPLWYLATANQEMGHAIELTPQALGVIPEAFLPDAGLLLHDRPAESEALEAARERSNLALALTLDPPEASRGHRIHLPKLIGALGHFQTLVKHSYGLARRRAGAGVRYMAPLEQGHVLDVLVPAAAGSFRVVLGASERVNLFGRSDLGDALEIVDNLFGHGEDPQGTLEAVKETRGHVATSFLRFLRFLHQNETGIDYRWAQPDFPGEKGHHIEQGQLLPLIEALEAVSNLGVEEVILTGILMKADVDSGAWRIEGEHGESSGKIRGGTTTLLGLRLGAKYRFSCIEEISETQLSGSEHRTLYLASHEPARG